MAIGSSSSSSTRQRVIKSMQGITLVKVQERTYRVPTASLDPNARLVQNDAFSSSSGSDDESTIYTEEIITHHHPVHAHFHGLLVGRNGSHLKQLRIDTGTRIDIAKGRETVMIKGTQDKVDKAIATIDKLVQEAYEKARPTHFLSLPIASTFATRKLEEFQSSILSSTFKSDGLEPSIMVSPANIHITLGVLKLLHKADVDRAVRVLKEECPKVISENMAGRGLSVHLRNIAIMQSNPANAHVLYIEPNEENQDQQPLRKLCLALIDKMVQAGLMVPDDRPLKTHVTLINTAHRSGKDRKRQAFDARPILKEFPHLDLGTAPLDKLHLMKMGRTGKGGTYESQGSIPIEP